MKKKIIGILMCAFMMLSLTGCGKTNEDEKPKEPTTKTLTCKSNQSASGINIDMSVEGKFDTSDNYIRNFKMVAVFDYSEYFKTLGIEINDDVRETMKEELEKQLSGSLDGLEGFDLDSSVEGSTFTIEASSDYDRLKENHSDKFVESGEFSLRGFETEYTSQGFTCE